MKANFGMIVVAGSGKIGGHVASRNRAGAYFRTKVTPVNPQSTAQLGARNRLGTRAQAWRGLTDAQRASWNNAVGSFAKTDIFGALRNPSGSNLYQKLNNNLVSVGIAPIATAPLPSAVTTVAITAMTATVTGQAVSVVASGAVPAGTSVKVFATAPQSAGVSFVKSEFRLISVLPPAAVSPFALTTSYGAKFGAFVAGQKIFVKLVFVNNTTGQESLPVQVSVIAS